MSYTDAEDRVVSFLEARGLMSQIDEVLTAHFVTLEEVLGRSKLARIARGRHACWAKLYDVGGLSYPELGTLWDRHHSTIINGVRRARADEESAA